MPNRHRRRKSNLSKPLPLETHYSVESEMRSYEKECAVSLSSSVSFGQIQALDSEDVWDDSELIKAFAEAKLAGLIGLDKEANAPLPGKWVLVSKEDRIPNTEIKPKLKIISQETLPGHQDIEVELGSVAPEINKATHRNEVKNESNLEFSYQRRVHSTKETLIPDHFENEVKHKPNKSDTKYQKGPNENFCPKSGSIPALLHSWYVAGYEAGRYEAMLAAQSVRRKS